MTKDDAIRVIERYSPCAHEAAINLSFYKMKCEDCGSVFDRDRLPDAQKRVAEFEDAIQTLRGEK